MTAPPPEIYLPRGAARALMLSRDPEVLLSGPAGTGKSRACLEKLHLCALKYPGMRGLITRKTRAALDEAALVTFEEKVLPAETHLTRRAHRRTRGTYRYPNGSEIALRGLSRASRIMSSEYDLVYVQEAIELDEEDWESLLTRLRHGVMPFQQLLADTNPHTPTHWLKQRADRGQIRLLESRHEDNPTLWSVRQQAWTDSGRGYLERLDALTGPRKQRLRFGRWVQAEGLVYEEWDRAVHVIPVRPLKREWTRYWVIDFGFTNPFVWQHWMEDPDGRLYLVQELYETGRLVEDMAREILALTRDHRAPMAILCDHDAEDRATLERAFQQRTYPAYKAVSPGIQAVKSRLRVAGDGRPRLMVMENALFRRDPARAAAKRPCSSLEEVDGYVWSPDREAPLKQDDHGMDCWRYLVALVDGLGRHRLT
jgi:hypothetical protein